MNKYKKGFTPEEVALIAVGLSQHQEIPHIRQQQAPQGYSSADISDIQYTINEENEKIAQAHEIMEALIDETYLSYKFERNESGKKSVLEIYKHDFYNHDEDYLYSEKTQLTKASLAKWFEEAGEINISKIFKDPEKIVPINHFKQAFTAEHAALIAVGLQYYSSIESALEGRQYQEDELFHAKRIIEQGGEYTDLEVDSKLEGDSIYNATNIKEALLEEIKIGYQNLNFNLVAADFAGIGMNPNAISPARGTEIVIDSEKYENKDDIEYEKTLITKHSVAMWLWHSGNKEYATNVQGNIVEIIEEASKNKNNLSKAVNNIYDNFNKTNADNTSHEPIKKKTFDLTITTTNVWESLYENTKKAVEEFPNWKSNQPRINNIQKSQIDTWLQTELKITIREAETIKKVLTEIYSL